MKAPSRTEIRRKRSLPRSSAIKAELERETLALLKKTAEDERPSRWKWAASLRPKSSARGLSKPKPAPRPKPKSRNRKAVLAAYKAKRGID